MIEFNCEHCGEELEYPDSLGGGEETCPECGKTITIPLAYYEDDDDLDDLSLDSVSDDDAARIDLGDGTPPSRSDDDAIELEPEGDEHQPRKKIIHSGSGGWTHPTPAGTAGTGDEGIHLETHEGPRKRIVAEGGGVAQPQKKMLGEGVPTGIRKHNLYLVVDHNSMVAYHTNDGWLIHVKDGYASARMNEKLIPSNGQFVLVVVEVGQDDHGHNRLEDIQAFRLQERFALKALAGDPADIFQTVTARAELEDRQKKVVRKRIDAKFLPHIWEGAEGLL